MGAIERWKRNQVERSESDVELDAKNQHDLKDRSWTGESFGLRPDSVYEHDERDTKNRDDQVRNDAREGDDDVSLLEIAVIAGIDRYRLRSSKHRGMRDKKQERQDDRHERIDMLCRIPCEPSQLIRRHVAVLEGGVAMSVLMGDHREEENRGDQNELLD